MRALVGAVCLLLLTAGVVAAHASLVESDPPDGGTVFVPGTITATFDEALDAGRSRIVVRDESGQEVARGGVGTDALQLSVELPVLPTGSYVARWTAVTPDDQGVTRGTFEFTALPAPPSPTAPATPAPPPIATPTPAPDATPTAAPATASPAPAATPTAATSPSPSPSPSPEEPEGQESDLLIALLVAGVLLGGLALYLFRR
jgi:methionine-rich copper-binding protein CopC